MVIAAVMDNGVNGRIEASVNSEVESIIRQFSSLSINGGESEVQKSEKDPRRIARKYQLDLCKKAMEENIIVYLGTGCGKTHIAVLLIYEMRHLIKKPQKNICVFLAPTIALVEQQASVIRDSLDCEVRVFCRNSTGKKSHREWEKDIERYEVFVMIPQKLVQTLSHRFIRIDQIALLIFDECHYAQTERNHPYAEIMKIFYKSDAVKLPRIFGMTASPQSGKDASINSLEALLHAKIYSVEDEKELEQFVASPELKLYYYSTHLSSSLLPHEDYSNKLDEIKNKCLSTLRTNTDVLNGLHTKEMSLLKLHGTMLLCLENLGIWGALQASQILSRNDENEVQCSGNSISQEYLSQISSAFASECTKVNVGGTIADFTSLEVLDEAFFSRKILMLIGILMNFRSKPDMKCIIFVDRIIMARSLAHLLGNLKFLSSWKPEFLVGVNNGIMSRKDTTIILDKFRSGELNLLVATKVGEEGLDIQTCCLVIRFDLPQNFASYIQSRGRARMAQSEYAFLVDSGNEMELKLINSFIKSEEKMNEEIKSRTRTEVFLDFDGKIYKVDSTGATISDVLSVSLLHRYCSKLPHDEFFHPKPQFLYFDDSEGRICSLILPANAPIRQIVSSPQSSGAAARKDACLKACEKLHKLGALTDYLLQHDDDDDDVEELLNGSSDVDGSKDENSLRELHEMVIPAVLREPWANMENNIYLNSYIIKINPHPADRIYKEFGLFVKSPLPVEAETMKIDLHLARGRHVYTELVPNDGETFDKDQIILAEKFQELCLKVLLDRSELIPEFVSLRGTSYKSSSPTFYLMLPLIITNGNIKKLRVDWKLVRRCLSSPTFRTPIDNFCTGIHITKDYLQLADGTKSVADIVNSFVYAPCKDIFFFVSDIVYDKNAYSSFNKSDSHVDHYADVFNITLLYPSQPLLRAKRLFNVENLLRKKGHSDIREKKEHFIDLPPEICQLKIIGFSKDIGSSLSLLPSIMHRLENLLVAIQLKHRLSDSFPEGANVSADRVLEALTTEKCSEKFSLERLEVLGDAFLKFAVGRHLFLLHGSLDEGQLTRKRSNLVNNSNLYKLAIMKNLQVYIRDWSFEPSQFFALGRPCLLKCTEEAEITIHSSQEDKNDQNAEIRCNKCHSWLYRKTIADVVEALVGAFLVDSGFKAATAFLKWIGIKVDFKAEETTQICSLTSPFISLSSKIDISALENTLGYQFTHKGLLIQAFLHPSYNTSFGGCYQRLEFLGDAVLDYLMTSYLFSVYPNLKPGQLTDLRSLSVNNISFADVAVSKSFHKYIICDSAALCKSIEKYVDFLKSSASGLDPTEVRCPKALGDLVESYIGAVLLDTGFDLECVWNLMLSLLDPIMKYSKLKHSPIRQLLELCQSRNWNLEYPAAKKVKGEFFVEAKINGEGIYANSSATALSIKDATKMAAKKLVSKLKAEGYSVYKSLEEVLKTSQKMEAKLIGFDENSTYASVNPWIEKIPNIYHRKVHPISAESTKIKHLSVGSTSLLPTPYQHPRFHLVKASEKVNSNAGSQATAGKSSKSRLHEICVANHWAPPVYACWKETGPDHLKEYIYKVVVVMNETPKPVLESFSDTRSRIREAAEHAAEGALWYLENEGYFQH